MQTENKTGKKVRRLRKGEFVRLGDWVNCEENLSTTTKKEFYESLLTEPGHLGWVPASPYWVGLKIGDYPESPAIYARVLPKKPTTVKNKTKQK